MKRLATALAWSGLLAAAPATAANIIIENRDAAGEGFNDPAPIIPAGGNGATTIGQARLLAFTHAASLWAASLHSPVDIRVDAKMDPLTCSPTTGILGSAGTRTVHRDFPGARLPATWYPQALANAHAGVDLDPSTSDIAATFTSALDGGACLGGSRWYYGFDRAPPPGDVDFVTIVLHELGHGLGFQSFVTLANGAKLGDHDDVYMRHLEQHGALPPGYPAMTNGQRLAASTSDPNLQWTGVGVNALGASLLSVGLVGGQVRMHAPPVQEPGSSVSHFSTALAPSQLMEPFYTGPDHDLALTRALLVDLGWSATGGISVAVASSSPWSVALLAVGLFAVAARVARRGRAARRPAPRPSPGVTPGS